MRLGAIIILLMILALISIPASAQDPILLMCQKEVVHGQMYNHLSWGDTSQCGMKAYTVWRSEGPRGPWHIVRVVFSFGNGGDYYEIINNDKFYCYKVQGIMDPSP